MKPDPPRRPDASQTLVFAGKPLTLADFGLPGAGFGADAVDAVLQHYSGQAFYRVTDKKGTAQLVAANGAATTLPTAVAMIEQAPKLLPGARLVSAEVLTEYDNYYYLRRPERRANPLPIVRVRFDDPQATCFISIQSQVGSPNAARGPTVFSAGFITACTRSIFGGCGSDARCGTSSSSRSPWAERYSR
jgi:hypothetical protein